MTSPYRVMIPSSASSELAAMFQNLPAFTAGAGVGPLSLAPTKAACGPVVLLGDVLSDDVADDLRLECVQLPALPAVLFDISGGAAV